MRIAQITQVCVPVPPKKYGGSELVVSLLTEELVRRGHDVTLFATGDSQTKAELHCLYDEAVGFEKDQLFRHPAKIYMISNLLDKYIEKNKGDFSIILKNIKPVFP